MIGIHAKSIQLALQDFLNEIWHLDHITALKLAKRPLKDKAEDVTSEILSSALNVHPLLPIIRYILKDITKHCAAIDVIGKNRASLLHVRHIEELYTISKFLFSSPDRYDEYAWRWENFQFIHGIRNRILNLNRPLDKVMTDWLEANIERMKTYFHKKFELDPKKCRKQWENLSNWLYGIQLKEIFKETGRLNSYISESYDWNSQSVHLSPLGDQYFGYVLKHQDYAEFALVSACTQLHKMCHECSAIVVDQERLRKFYLREVLVETYEMITKRPQQYIELANKGRQYEKLTELILQKPFDFNAIMETALGTPLKDPLILQF